MKFVRLYTGQDQQSHFEDDALSLAEIEYGHLTNNIPVQGLFFGEIDNPREIDWHNAPRAQYVIMLKGAMEIEIGDGTKQIFKEGDILLAEDTTGQGHITRAASAGPRQYMVIPLQNDE